MLYAPLAAAAEPAHRYAVKWTTAIGAETCRQSPELEAAIGKLVSPESLVAPELADRTIVGAASRRGSWLAVLRVQDVSGNVLGERELKSDASTCGELDDSVALAIALIIAPEHVLAAETDATPQPPAGPPSAPPARPPARPPPRAVTVVPAARFREPPARPYRAPQRSLKGGAVGVVGLLPEVALGAQLEFWLPVSGADSLRFSVAYFGAQTRGVPDRPSVDTTFHATTTRAAYCPSLSANSKYFVFGCAGLESGLIVARGNGGGYDSTTTRALLALDVALTADRMLAGPWALSATVGGSVTPFRPTFSYEAVPSPIRVYRRGVGEGRLEIGLAYRF